MAEPGASASIDPMSHVVPAAVAPTSLLAVTDLDPWQVGALLELSAVMKRHPAAWDHCLEGRTVVCVFPSTCVTSRLAFTLAVHRLGAHPVTLTPADLETELGESLADAARMLSASCDAIAVHAFPHRDLQALTEHARVPVINTHSRHYDPWHGLTECLTLQERFGALDGLAVACLGATDHIVHALLELAPRTGIELRLASRSTALADPWTLASAGQAVHVVDDPAEAVAGARAVYTDAGGHPVTPEMLVGAAPDALVVHGPSLEHATNRVPMAQALLYTLITGDWET